MQPLRTLAALVEDLSLILSPYIATNSNFSGALTPAPGLFWHQSHMVPIQKNIYTHKTYFESLQ